MTIHLLAPENKNKWPPIWKKCFNIWEQTKYDLKVWTDKDIDNLLQEDDKEFYKDYLDKLDPIYKWDYVRYIILEKYGGAYFDMDVELQMDFLPLLNPNKLYLAEGEQNCLVSNHIMISPPDHRFWYNIKQQLKYKLIDQFNKAKTSEYYTIETVGPVGLSYILAKEKYNYTPLSCYHFGSKKTDLQLCIHHTSRKWAENKQRPYKDFYLIP